MLKLSSQYIIMGFKHSNFRARCSGMHEDVPILKFLWYPAFWGYSFLKYKHIIWLLTPYNTWDLRISFDFLGFSQDSTGILMFFRLQCGLSPAFTLSLLLIFLVHCILIFSLCMICFKLGQNLLSILQWTINKRSWWDIIFS